MRTVKSGYSFNFFTEQEVSHISLERTGAKVMVEGGMPIRDCKVKEYGTIIWR